MSDPVDLREVLANWPYDPENDVRVVPGNDGRLILQVRLPMGVEQYELDGRPDGLHPHAKESALVFHLERLAQAKAADQLASFSLSAEDCAELFSEGALYYYRYLHLFQIKDWPRTARDTERNLRLFDLAHRYAVREEDQQHLEQWRPYILRMNAVARAMMDWETGRHAKALEHLHGAIHKIESLEPMDDETFQFERQRSLKALRELAAHIANSQPVSELERLERELRAAIQTQAFERAAQLRDQIRARRHKEAAP